MFDTASGWLITRLDVNPIIAPLFSQDAAYRTPNRPHFTARTCLKDTICARSPQKKFIWPMSVKISRISELLEGVESKPGKCARRKRRSEKDAAAGSQPLALSVPPETSLTRRASPAHREGFIALSDASQRHVLRVGSSGAEPRGDGPAPNILVDQ
jgi:hypothetical protein